MIRHLAAQAARHLVRNGAPPPIPKTRNVPAHLAFLWSIVRLGFRWEPKAEAPLHRRSYRSYAEYLQHQRSKLPRLDLRRYDEEYRRELKERVAELAIVHPGHRVLCLAARIGTEVKAFIDLGAFAIGIDLNPGPGNAYVVHGDFHALQYAGSSVDLVFSNSLDHAFDLEKLLGEVRRVLAPGGLLLIEVGLGLNEGGSPEFYESLAWNSAAELVKTIESAGFTTLQQREFERPAPGLQVLMRRGAGDAKVGGA